MKAGLRYSFSTMNNVYLFYLRPDTVPPGGKYSYNRVMNFNDDELETFHDYIQFLLPSDQKSKYNSKVDILTPDIVKLFQRDESIMTRVREAFAKMMGFWNISLKRINNEGDHNHLRLTRCMRCLKLLGLQNELEVLRDFLLKIGRVTSETLRIWKPFLEEKLTAKAGPPTTPSLQGEDLSTTSELYR
jgi:hypothetical protein